MTERDKRLKRLKIRCWRRGTKEMDLLFGQFADGALAGLSNPELDQFETLMDENDQDLYRWVSGGEAHPETHGAMLREIAAFHGIES